MIVKQTGPVSYNVQGQDADVTFRRHGDKFRPLVVEDDPVKQTDCPGTDTPIKPCASEEEKQAVSEIIQWEDLTYLLSSIHVGTFFWTCSVHCNVC